MISIQLAVLFLASLAIGSCHREFQCQFKNDQFQVDFNRRPSEPYKRKYLFGEREASPLYFKSRADLTKFYNRVDRIRKSMYTDFVYDDMEFFTDAYKAVQQSNIETLNHFYEEYATPPEKYHDSFGLLIKLMRKISNEIRDHNVKNSFYIGLSLLGVNNTILETIETRAGDVPPSPYVYQELDGIIKVEVKGKKGYIILSMESSPVFPTPFIMEDDPETQAAVYRWRTHENPDRFFQYKIVGNSKSHIKVLKYKEESLKDEPVLHALIYGKPFCSFRVEHNRLSLEHVVMRTYMRYSSDYVFKGYIFSKITQPHAQAYSQDPNFFMFDMGYNLPSIYDWDAVYGISKTSMNIKEDTSLYLDTENASFRQLAKLLGVTPSELKMKCLEIETIINKMRRNAEEQARYLAMQEAQRAYNAQDDSDDSSE